MTHLLVAVAAQAEALGAIHAAAFATGEVWHAADFSQLLAMPGTSGFIDPRGGLVLMRVAADEAEILTIGVVPALRRTGAGRSLLRAAVNRVAEQGASSVFLEVAEINAPARAFYASTGFDEVGRRPRYYADGGDALVMRISLSANIVS